MAQLAFCTVVISALIATSLAKKPWGDFSRPYNIGHRGGATWVAPEETLLDYRNGFDEGADFSECDVCWSKDLVPICRHEPFLSQTTDALTKFPDMIKTKTLDGSVITDVWAEDLTLAQLKTLRTHQKYVAPTTNRTHRYDGLFPILSLEEHIKLVQAQGRTIGIYPELKHSTYFNGLPIFKDANTTTMDELLKMLTKYKYAGPLNSAAWRRNPVFIQSFEQNDLVYVAQKTCIPLVQLTDGPGTFTVDRNTSNADLLSDASLAEIATYASGFGPWKVSLAAPPDTYASGALVDTGLMTLLHKHGFQVHPYTFRPEMNQMAPVWGGVALDEISYYLRTIQCDGLFTDSSTHVHEYFALEKLAGRKWPTSLQNRLNAKPTTCKRGNTQQRMLAKQQYPSIMV